MSISAFDQLLDLINESNPQQIPFTLNDLMFSSPVPDSTGNWDTRCTVSAARGSRYTGQVIVYYSRINLDAIGPTLQFQSEAPFDIDTLTDMLNAVDNTFFITGDIVDNLPDMNVGDIDTVTLTASQGSLGWTGSVDVTLMVGLPPNVPSLHNLVTVILPSDNYLTPA